LGLRPYLARSLPAGRRSVKRAKAPEKPVGALRCLHRGGIHAGASAKDGHLASVVWEHLTMPAQLKYVDPNRPRSHLSRAYASFSSTRLGRLISSSIAWKVDPHLLRATRGRVGMGLVLPTALLETRGAKSGAVRRNAVIYFHDGALVTIVASKAGAERHPAWFHNLRAHPDVTFGGIPMRATVVGDEAERRRLWTLADRVFAPYATYRREAARANRTIPIVQLRARF
jgi:deazaflavin-dependent oxidoreductase (nitroreductase family)